MTIKSKNTAYFWVRQISSFAAEAAAAAREKSSHHIAYGLPKHSTCRLKLSQLLENGNRLESDDLIIFQKSLEQTLYASLEIVQTDIVLCCWPFVLLSRANAHTNTWMFHTHSALPGFHGGNMIAVLQLILSCSVDQFPLIPCHAMLCFLLRVATG